MFRNTSRRILYVSWPMIVRVGLAVVSLIVSGVLGWVMLVGAHSAAHASAPTIRETALPSTVPWGVAFDNTGNVWVEEQGWVMALGGGPQVGRIAKIIGQGLVLGKNFIKPSGISSPWFVKLDGGGIIGFTKRDTMAFGD